MRRYSLANNNSNNNNNSTTPAVKIVVLGDKGVGKSALVVRFLTKRFIGEYASNIQISYPREVNLGGNWTTAEICDALLEQDRSQSLKKLAPKTDAYLIVYSVCNRDSFDYACSTAHEIQLGQTNNQQKSTPMVLVGNKSDLDHFREVKRSDCEEFVKTLPNSFFVETSAAESYAEVEDAFKLAFKLIKTRINTSPTQFTATGQSTRRRSFRQVAHLIRGHLSSNARSTTSLDEKNMSNNELRSKRRQNRYAVNQSNASSGFYLNTNTALNEKCVSLSTLNETPNTSGDSDRDMERTSPTGLYQNGHYHTMDSGMNARFTSNEGPWVRRTLKNNRLNKASSEITISTSTDDNFDLSDQSLLDDDIFLPESNGAISRRKMITNSPSPVSEKQIAGKRVATVQRKTSMNKNNLTITVNGVHSDGECIEKALQEASPQYPPKSAPVLAATSNKFRFFPNGATEQHDIIKNGEFSVSPLLEVGGKKPSFPTFKDEKRNPTPNLLKQFLKGTFYGPNSKLKDSLSPATSDSSISSASTLADDTIYFRASTTSLAAIIGNDSSTNGEFEPISRRTSKQKVFVSNDVVKPRRPSFREAVGELMKKRKKSRNTEIHKHTIKERVF